MKSMIIQSDTGQKAHFVCSSCYFVPIKEEDVKMVKDSTIPIFYSVKHAKDEGWLRTSHIHFCPPDKKFVWLCPDCVAKFINPLKNLKVKRIKHVE